MNTSDSDAVDRIIRARKTSKMMLSPELASEARSTWQDEHHRELVRMVEGAAWAPFHKRADEATHRGGAMSSAMPWRFHVLEGQACSSLIAFLEQQANDNPDSKWSRAWQSKIKNMLAACGALVQATWLPDPVEHGDGPPAMTMNNVEHIAAASAAIQNLLLSAEARGWKSYWSSGGILRDPDVFKQLGIGSNEALLGSVFLTPEVHEQATEKLGGLREERNELSSWARWV